MRHLLIIVFVCLVMANLHAISPEELEELTNECFLDGIAVNFRNFPGSDIYIKKYALTDDEITMIGIWGFDSIVCKTPRDRKYGPGISIRFYPNRYFKIEKENRDNNQIRSTYGKWQVLNKILLVKFEAKLLIIDKQSKNTYDKYDVEYFEGSNYHPIFKIQNYEKAYYNSEAFNWSTLPLQIRNFFEILIDDAPRSRLLLDALGDPPGNIQPNSKYGKLLLDSQSSKKYFVDLLDMW